MSILLCLSVRLSASISPKLQSSLCHFRVTFQLVCRARVADRLHISDSARPSSVLPVASQSDPELSTWTVTVVALHRYIAACLPRHVAKFANLSVARYQASWVYG